MSNLLEMKKRNLSLLRISLIFLLWIGLSILSTDLCLFLSSIITLFLSSYLFLNGPFSASF